MDDSERLERMRRLPIEEQIKVLSSTLDELRARRQEWEGTDEQESVEHDIEVRVYASWNGATQVAAWEVLAGPSPGQLESVGSVPRSGFETAMLVQTSEPYVAVRAKHHLGEVLGTTAPVKL